MQNKIFGNTLDILKPSSQFNLVAKKSRIFYINYISLLKIYKLKKMKIFACNKLKLNQIQNQLSS